MTEVVGQAAGVTIELDVERLCERLGQHVSKQVAENLAGLFPSEAAEFWAALCNQAYRERQRVAAMLDITCPQHGGCPYKPEILAGIRFEGENTAGPQPGSSAKPSSVKHAPGSTRRAQPE